MELDIEIINPLKQEGWDELVLNLKGYSFFHSTSWVKVLKETYNYKPLFFVAKDKENIVAILPLVEVNSFFTGRRGVALPFTDFCEPIFLKKDNESGFMRQLLGYACSKGWKYLEIRGNITYLEESKKEYVSYFNHNLFFEVGLDNIYSKFRESNKRNIKKSISNDVKVNISTTLEEVEKFYSLNCITRKRHGLPPQPFKFFKNIYDHIISNNRGFVAIARWHEIEVGGAIFFHFGEKAIYKYGASDISYQELRANNLIMWEAIQWYSQNNFKSFSFGRTELGHKGLLQFKRGWGASEDIIHYYRFDPQNNELMKRPPSNKSFQNYATKLPTVALRALGAVLYKHVG